MAATDMGTIWHYTTLEGLIGIVQSQRLWATSAEYLNDTAEMRTYGHTLGAEVERMNLRPGEPGHKAGMKLAQDFTPNRVDDIYIASATKERDLLSLWRGYGRDGGFAIGLDRSCELKPYEQRPLGSAVSSPDGSDDGEVPQVKVSAWRDAEYLRPSDEPRARDQLKAHIDRATASPYPSASVTLWHAVSSDVPLKKHVAFEDEREVRLVAAVGPDRRFVKYRPGPYGLTPYIELAAGPSSKDFIPHGAAQGLPIVDVMIGPSHPHKERAKWAVERLLQGAGYTDVQVGVSEAPYR